MKKFNLLLLLPSLLFGFNNYTFAGWAETGFETSCAVFCGLVGVGISAIPTVGFGAGVGFLGGAGVGGLVCPIITEGIFGDDNKENRKILRNASC